MLADILAAVDVIIDRTPIWLVGDARTLAASHEAVAAVDGRVLATWAWADVATGVPPAGTRPVLLIETAGAAAEVLGAALPPLDATARALDLPVVVSLSAESIDPVAAAMFGPQVQLLCDAGPGELALALALAAQMIDRPAISDRTYEGEAARLQRLNAEVARIADVLSKISQREESEQQRVSARFLEKSQSFHHAPTDDIIIEAIEIRKAIRGRRLRDQFFGNGIFEEPGWDIVLDLFAAELEGTRVSVSSLCIAAAVAPTTALRWVSKLTEAGLLDRQPDPFDRRRAYIELSERASRAMRDYMAAMRRAGLSLA